MILLLHTRIYIHSIYKNLKNVHSSHYFNYHIYMLVIILQVTTKKLTPKTKSK